MVAQNQTQWIRAGPGSDNAARAEAFSGDVFSACGYEFPRAIPLAQSWDSGRDVAVFDKPAGRNGDVVFQYKFSKDLLAAKGKIAAPLDALAQNGRHMARWILCVPVDPSGVFMNWLEREFSDRGIAGHLWACGDLVARLERHPDVLETFFYPVFAELASCFRSEHLELFKLTLDSTCEWRRQEDAEVLGFSRYANVNSPDLLLDLIVRNTGTVGTALTGIEAEIFDWRPKLHGLPGDGFLFPQITYSVSIHGGKSGIHSKDCERPLLVKAGDLERFKIRITDTGYAWNGGLRISLMSGPLERLRLPAMRSWA